VTELLVAAFEALMPAASMNERAAVARAVLEAKDPETLELLDSAGVDELCQIAVDAGIDDLAALDFIAGLALAREEDRVRS
jgi:hypothetical protein